MNIIIDGKSCEAEKGEFILQVARRNNIYIPTLCHNDALPGLGSCRLCIVELIDRGRSKIVTSCLFPIEKEIEVITNSERIKKARNNICMLLLARCPENEEIKKMARAFKVDRNRVERFKLDSTENCVLCGLCVKACNEMGTGAISTINRGKYKEVNTPYKEPSPQCIGCGSCANVCPTNAIKVIDKENEREIWGKKFKLVRCSSCGRAFSTQEHMRFTYRNLEEKADNDILCDKCKRKINAKKIRNVYGI